MKIHDLIGEVLVEFESGLPIAKSIQNVFPNNLAMLKPNDNLSFIPDPLSLRRHVVYRFPGFGDDLCMNDAGFLRSPIRSGKDHDTTHHTRLRITRNTEPIGPLLGINKKS